MARKSYSLEDVNEVLGILAKNNGNIKKTARETGVAQNTLKKWKDDDPENYELLEEQTIQMIKEGQMIVLQNNIQNLVLATERLKEIIPSEHNIDRLTNVVKTVGDQIKTLTGSKKVEGGEEKEFIAVFREK